MTRQERRAIRHDVRKIWFWAMLITVMAAVALRRQPWFAIEWWWVPVSAVAINALCTWLATKMVWGNR